VGVVSSSGRRRSIGCASNLALDELAAGDLAGTSREAALRAHIDGCASCRQRLAARQADPALPFDAGAAAPLLAIEAARRRHPRPFLAATVAAAGGLAAAAAILLLWSPGDRPPAPAPAPAPGRHERSKGAFAFTVDVTRAGAPPETITDEGRVRAGDELRFNLALSAPGHAVVLSLRTDGAAGGAVAQQYVPAAGGARAVAVGPPGPTTLETRVMARGGAGLERVFAIVCPTETSPETLRRQAEAALTRGGGRPEAVLSLGTGCVERSVVLRREP
jgi:hypothetical protein